MKHTFSAPTIHPIRNIKIPAVDSFQLDNGLESHFVLAGTQEVVKIELVFWAGRPYEQAQLIARTTAALIKEGTPQLRQAQISEAMDYYGAGMLVPVQTDTAQFTLYALSKELVNVLPTFIEMLLNPAFEQKDLVNYIARQRQRIKEDLSKNEVLAYRQLTEAFYGREHAYGYNSYPDSYEDINRELLLEHHQRCYNADNAFVIVSGQMDAQTQQFICQQLSRLPQGQAQQAQHLTGTAQPKAYYKTQGQGHMQSAIRMGRKLFARTHKDAKDFYILSTLLGGYFGSRLMANIREQKGYSYQVSANYESLRFDGSFQIDTEVAPQYVEATIKEIHFEIDRLQNEAVAQEEINMLRNYMMGSFLSMVDGPFSWAETIRTLRIEQLGVSAFSELIESVQSINSQRIQQLAQEYLKKEDLWTVVVGE